MSKPHRYIRCGHIHILQLLLLSSIPKQFQKFLFVFWFFFTDVWVTKNLLKNPLLFNEILADSKWRDMNGLHFSSHQYLAKSPSLVLMINSKGTNYECDQHIQQYIWFSNKIWVFVFLFSFFFNFIVCRKGKIHKRTIFFLLTIGLGFWSAFYYFWYYYPYYVTSWEFLYISVSWCSFSGAWVAVSILKSSGLLSVFRPISTML